MSDAIPVSRKRGRPAVGAVNVGVRVPPTLLTAVDAFIEDRRTFGETLTRPEALRRLATEALIGMGLLRPY